MTMRRKRRATMQIATLLLTGCAAPGRTQDLATSVQLRGVPFQAVQVVTRDTSTGTTVTRGRMARDRAGSTYVEMVDPRTGVATTAFLLDVPGHRGVVLDLVHKRYSIRPAPAMTSRELAYIGVPDLLELAARTKGQSESQLFHGVPCTVTHLGAQLVAGLMSVGSAEICPAQAGEAPSSLHETNRDTSRDLSQETIGAPERNQNQQPDREVTRWLSVDLGVFVEMTEIDGTRREKTKVGLTEVLRTEPNPSLFRIPAEFRSDTNPAGAPAAATPGPSADRD